MNLLEYAVFGTLVIANFSLGLYFSFAQHLRRGTGSTSTVLEVFLGGRTLGMLPLAASSVASIFSSTGLVAIPAHYYAYGWHLLWTGLVTLFVLPLASHVFVPVVYRLKITSIFQYIGLRFNSAISMTACVIYIFLTQSIGAIAISAASLAIQTVFHVPVLWCNVAIGLSGTLYTSLGGLRGVVWTDCVQFLIIICASATIVAKFVYDCMSESSLIHPLDELDIFKYVAKYSLDFTSDENMWSCLFGGVVPAMSRLCFDQVVAQRLLASRTVKDAQRTAITNSFLLVFAYGALLSMGVALTIWFRGCDPLLSGAIDSADKIVPYYVNTRLVQVPGFVGLFLAGVVCAATSTTSSTINSQAAILYVDVISPRWKNATRHVLWITRCTALALGVTMTMYSTLCVYMGSLSRIFLMVYTSLASPFVGLCLLALLFPSVHSKGAGAATVVTAVFQLWHITNTMRRGTTPPRMPVSLEYCPGNLTLNTSTANAFDTSRAFDAASSEEPIFILRMSYYWTSFFAIFATAGIAVLVSALTGEMWSKEQEPGLCSDLLVRIWRNATSLRIMPQHRKKKTTDLNGDDRGNLIQDLLVHRTESQV